MRRLLLGIAAVAMAVWTGCRCGDAEGPEGGSPVASVPEGTGGEGSGAAGGDGDGGAEDGAPAEGSVDAESTAELWIGIYCSADEPGVHRFSVYVDGALVQAVDGSCTVDAEPGLRPPNAGQFSVTVPTGVRVLRFQDDTSDYFSEHEVAVPGDHWLFIHHRVLGGGTGHLTSMIDRYERPRFAY